MNAMLKNWLTTFFGSSTGAAIATAMGWKNPDGSINWPAIATWVLFTLWGAVQKDARMTGGTKALTPEAEGRAALAKVQLDAKSDSL